jgi:peptidoglycan/LPS O-acetylase OafA/YrhL
VTASARRSERLVGLDLLRVLSIVLVFATHALLRIRRETDVGHRVVEKLSYGHYGVCIFFVISGFIITETILRREPDVRHLSRRDFYVRRIARLAPLAVVVLVTTGLLAIALPAGGGKAVVVRIPRAHFTWWFFLSYPAFLFNWARIYHQRFAFGWGVSWDVFWSLAIEEQFYLLYPALLRRVGTGRRLVTILLLTVVAGPVFARWTVAVHPRNAGLTLSSSPPGFALLALGCLVALALHDRPAWPSNRVAVASAAIGLGIIAWTMHSTDIGAHASERVWGPLLVGIGAAFAVVGLRRLSDRSILIRAAGRVGELSYGLYILQALVLLALWSALPHLEPFTGFAVFTAATIAVAFASYRLFELPMNKRIRRALGRPRRVNA